MTVWLCIHFQRLPNDIYSAVLVHFQYTMCYIHILVIFNVLSVTRTNGPLNPQVCLHVPKKPFRC